MCSCATSTIPPTASTGWGRPSATSTARSSTMIRRRSRATSWSWGARRSRHLPRHRSRPMATPPPGVPPPRTPEWIPRPQGRGGPAVPAKVAPPLLRPLRSSPPHPLPLPRSSPRLPSWPPPRCRRTPGSGRVAVGGTPPTVVVARPPVTAAAAPEAEREGQDPARRGREHPVRADARAGRPLHGTAEPRLHDAEPGARLRPTSRRRPTG